MRRSGPYGVVEIFSCSIAHSLDVSQGTRRGHTERKDKWEEEEELQQWTLSWWTIDWEKAILIVCKNHSSKKVAVRNCHVESFAELNIYLPSFTTNFTKSFEIFFWPRRPCSMEGTSCWAELRWELTLLEHGRLMNLLNCQCSIVEDWSRDGQGSFNTVRTSIVRSMHRKQLPRLNQHPQCQRRSRRIP